MPIMSPLSAPDADQAGSSRVSFRSSRMVLAIGFGGLIAIMALAGLDALRSLQQFRQSDEQIRRHYLSQNHALNDVRSDVYVSGTYVRDYLLEADLERAETYRIELEKVRRQMESALESYAHEVAPPEAQHYTASTRNAHRLLGDSDAHLQVGHSGAPAFRIRVSSGPSIPAPPEHAGDRGSDRQPQ